LRFLIDNALSPLVASALIEAGHDAVHVRDHGMADASDQAIFERARTDGRIVVSADTDFAQLLALGGERSPSVILFRGGTERRPAEQARLLLAHLDALAKDLEGGCVAVFEPGRIRIRATGPIGG